LSLATTSDLFAQVPVFVTPDALKNHVYL